ncbi:hypothetical protein [Agrobacterium vitis]|nr:hypothetical protein [Agrobacterium vitis]
MIGTGDAVAVGILLNAVDEQRPDQAPSALSTGVPTHASMDLV